MAKTEIEVLLDEAKELGITNLSKRNSIVTIKKAIEEATGSEPEAEAGKPQGKEVDRKIRILIKESDSSHITFDPKVEHKPELYPGYLVIFTDGSRQIEMDKVRASELDTKNTSAREQALINENAKLRNQIAESQGITQAPVFQEQPEQPVEAPELEAGETALPPVEDNLIGL